MSYERIKQPIVAENSLDRGHELNLRLLQIQLHYIEEKIKEGYSDGYLKLFKSITPIIGQVAYRREWYLNSQNSLESEEDEQEKREQEYILEISQEIDNIASRFSGEEREREVYSYIENLLSVYPKVPEENEGSAGLITVNTNKVYNDFDEAGLRDGDDLLEIHFSPAYARGGMVSAGEIKKWLSEIAIMIIEKYRKTRAVSGTSWLMSHPVMKRLGFTIVDNKDKEGGLGGSYWDQLIDQDGQINIDRLEHLEKKGELPYKVASGFISVEDFLKKYLPADRRGDVTLEKVDEDIRARRDPIRKEVEVELKGKWNEIIKEQQTVDDVFRKIPNFVEVARSIGLEVELRNFFQELISKKIGLEELRDNKEMIERFRPTMEKIEEKIKTDLVYVNYHLSI